MSDTDNLASDIVYRGALVALKKWRHEGRYSSDWRDYRESAVSWLKLAIERLEAIQ